MSKQTVFPGDRYERLVVVEYLRGTSGRPFSIICRCDCGRIHCVSGTGWRSTKSCGCYGKDHPSRLIHGMARKGATASEYTAWQGMIARCHHKKTVGYKNYGGRGIKVCKRWRNSFEAFLADVGPKPISKHSLGRINNDGNYELKNVRWETRTEQNNNTRSNRVLTFDGKTMNISAWARKLGVDHRLLLDRIKMGWSVERTLTSPKLATWSRRPCPARG